MVALMMLTRRAAARHAARGLAAWASGDLSLVRSLPAAELSHALCAQAPAHTAPSAPLGDALFGRPRARAARAESLLRIIQDPDVPGKGSWPLTVSTRCGVMKGSLLA